MLRKSVLRTIKGSLGRYLAIMAIIALGVGFFAGLRVTQTAMIRTADAYLQELKLYDYRLVSTLGWEESDVEAFRTLEGLATARGGFGTDVICLDSKGADVVLHAHALLEDVNGLALIEGRLPTSPDECVLDALNRKGLALGDVLTLSDSNPQEIRDNFARDSYTVVGFVNAATYINFERGSTALGDGSVGGFVYLCPEAFIYDCYTEIYLTLPESGAIYSAAYQAAVDAIRPAVEALLQTRAEVRYQGILDDAWAEIHTAQAELEQHKRELSDAKATFTEKSQELADAQSEIDAGWKALHTERAAAEIRLEEARVQLEQSRTSLDEAWDALAQAQADPSAALPQVQIQLQLMETALRQQEAEYAEGLSAYETSCAEAEAGFAAAEAELRDAQATVDDGRMQLAEAGTDISEAEEQIRQAEEEINDGMAAIGDVKPATVFALDRSANVGYASLENDTAIVSGVARVFPLFFFLVAALVCVTTMTRMVSEARTQNGVLKALGYSDGAIAGQYLFYAGSASVVGCVVGFLVGSKFMPMALWQVYNILYSIRRPVAFVLDVRLFLLCTALYLFCALGATWLVCHRDLRESSAQLMRPKAPMAGKRVLLERVTFLWKRIRFLHKVSIRNILLYRKRMIMMILGIGGCTALLLTGFGIRDTIQPVVDYQFNEIQQYDATVSFLHGLTEEEREDFAHTAADVTSDLTFLYTTGADILTKDGGGSIHLVAYDTPPEALVNLHRGDTPVTYPGAGEVVLNYRFADEQGIRVGDTVRVSNSDLATVEVTVTGIFDNYIYDYAFVSSDTLTGIWEGVDRPNTAYVCFPEAQDAKAAGAVLLGADGVANVTLNQDLRLRVSSMLESLDYIVLIVLVCAGALAFIVLYNLTNITITERTREIATLKVLGFFRKEQNAYVFRENLVLTGISALCGIPMGIALLRYVMSQIKINTLYFGCRLSPLSYLAAILITFVFTVTVDLALTFKTARINMAEAMKAVE